MEAYEQITLDQWVQWKEDIRQKLAETAGNFVHIGFRLKQIRDSGMFDGAADIFGFAEREYGLGKSTVSRFIAINERYSEGGDSLELKEEFRAFSSSKLSEMLTLPDNEIQLITERTTIREIRELKEFNRQEAGEEACRDGQGALQDPCQDAQGEGQGPWKGREAGGSLPPLEKCLADYFRDREGMLNGIMGALGKRPPGYREAMELMNPSGQTSHKKGIVFLFLYDWAAGAKYKLLTQPEPVSITWPELLDHVAGIYGACGRGNVWEAFYGAAATAPPVATSQQEGDVPEKGAGEGSSPASMEDVATAGAAEVSGTVGRPAVAEAVKGIPAAAAEGQGSPAGEGQLPGQMDVYDYPEVIPGGKEGGIPEDGGTGKEGVASGEDAAAAGPGEGARPGDGGRGPDGLSEHHEGPGAAEDDGCEEDPGDVSEMGEKTWKDVIYELEAVKRQVSLCNHDYPELKVKQLKDLYQASISLAAAVEGILMRRRADEQEHHA